MEFVTREHLTGVDHASMPTRVETSSVRLGRCENGSAWTLRIAGRHTLTVGCSGAGKGSVFWGIAAGFGPAVKAGLVRLVAIDLKYGIEVSVGSALLAGVTAYMSDPALRKQAWASLSRILTKGRAIGIVVAAFLQDPRKEVLPQRGLFTQTIALRLRSRDEVAMVLGEGLVDNAPAHRISPDTPGTGYVIAEDGAAMRIRADYWTDAQIRVAAAEYRPQAANRKR
jgi:S-DNA-T family DNA segregation ATPase FtsK/SpoIIIE